VGVSVRKCVHVFVRAQHKAIPADCFASTKSKPVILCLDRGSVKSPSSLISWIINQDQNFDSNHLEYAFLDSPG